MEVTAIKEVVRIKQEVTRPEIELYQQRIGSPDAAVAVAKKLIGDEDREVLLVICLNVKNQINAVHRCHVGKVDSSLFSSREIYKSAILNNAKQILVASNHPSEILEISRQEKEAAQKLSKAGEILDIPLLDYVLVTSDSHKSLREYGYIDYPQIPIN